MTLNVNLHRNMQFLRMVVSNKVNTDYFNTGPQTAEMGWGAGVIVSNREFHTRLSH